MTAQPDDDWLLSIGPQREQITAEDYERLPEEVCRAIEITAQPAAGRCSLPMSR